MNVGKIIALTLVLVMFGTCAYAADCNNGGRYEDNGDWTVTDCRTGLIWLLDANCTDTSGGISKAGGDLNWYDAMKWVAGLGQGICSLADGSDPGDWRLPTKTEWMAMVASAKKQGFTTPTLTNGAGTGTWTTGGDTFFNVQSGGYWSSTTGALGAGQVWGVDMSNGGVGGNFKGNDSYVWPVRGGQSGSFGSLTIE